MGWLDDNGLIYVWSKIKAMFATKDEVNELKNSMGELGYGDMMKNVYDKDGDGIVDNAEKVNGHTVGVDVPANAVFTDTTYENASAQKAGLMSVAHYNKLTNLTDNPVEVIDTDNGQIEPAQGVIMITGSGGLSTDATGDILQITGNSATSNTMGMMSPAHYNKLEALPTNANLESTYAKKTDITNVYKYKGSVASESALPTSDQAVGDVYDIKAASSYGAAGMNVAWNGTAWDALGEKFAIDSITNASIDTICV